MSEHIVREGAGLVYVVPSEFDGHSDGFTAGAAVDEPSGGVQMGFRIGRLERGGSVATHVHSFEESIYVITGELALTTTEGTVLLGPGDYGLLTVGSSHSLANHSSGAVEFAEMRAPLPRERFGYDTRFTPPLLERDPERIDVRDPRTRSYGHIAPENMDPTLQTQDRLALSASMRTALLVYSGITVKMMIDSDLGADLSTMFMVQYVPGGFAGPHDHPLEEAYLILEGEVEGTFDGSSYRLQPGDVAWAGVGCVHEFRNLGAGPVRWLETQAPQPPARHSYRFRRDWAYLEQALATDE